jgi:hypothetical protein
MRILDPFCGTATTALSAAYHGHEGLTTEINPFLIWLGRAKTDHYTPETIANCHDVALAALASIKRGGSRRIEAPPIHHIERWWSARALEFLCQLQPALEDASQSDVQVRSLLQVAFCRTLMTLSNATHNHQSISFKENRQLPLDFEADLSTIYAEDIAFVLSSASQNPEGRGTVLQGDARFISEVAPGLFDYVITSPPYANRMSYIRELRPYMYWLGFLESGREAGELDWVSIGGTWGIATSRLSEWKPGSEHFENAVLDRILLSVAHHENKNGRILANYIAKYFDDMWTHFKNLKPSLAVGAEIHYIVGNSSFYGVLLPVEQFYTVMLESLGFQSVHCAPIRKRNSKKELIEFDVSAIWNG